MTETELKIRLEEADRARLDGLPALAGLRRAERRTESLVSIYHDTADHRLAAAGISLRLRRIGRRWVETIKRRTGSQAEGGLFSHLEREFPVARRRLVLEGPDPDGALAAVREAAEGAALAPVFETRVKRVVERLAAPGGGEVELAIDEGEIVAGEARAPIREAELELVSGEVAAVYAVARELFPTGPVRFATENKAARGYRLAETGGADAPQRPRGAGTPRFGPEATVETAARDVFRDCLGQIAVNFAVVADSAAIEGPHQLRVGLRRLRTAFAAFGPSLGKAAMAPLAATAKEMGRVVGDLRDADVLMSEVVAGAARLGLDPAARGALDAALEARRDRVREKVRTALAGPEATAFLFDLGAFIEGRGWLVASDYSQTARLAAPIGEVAPGLLARRHRRAMKLGRRIRELDAAGLHQLRKELKKLRYTVDMFAPLYGGGRARDYLRALKELQDSFGSLNDAVMAGEALTGPEAPGAADPAAQRAVGWTLGALAVQVGDDRPRLFEHWDRLADTRPFWR
ncbi:CYTH and CHAD domain-containing protein [Amaricoccus sp.]|uniref:CYTH and CHAD domain-containing protein n=1 Tax=Amaricoccus sp. TaxID=1872485 RepID=UPI00260CA65F|nr:CYTH and CHAD domain-containing protein [Amaricoccus sp.]HRO10466.1 CHAD domain-containing protein [Amaricoccus sp.]